MREEGQHRIHAGTGASGTLSMHEFCASLRRYYPVQVVRVRSAFAALQSQRCAPLAEYNIYLFTIVLYCGSVKLGESFQKRFQKRFRLENRRKYSIVDSN